MSETGTITTSPPLTAEAVERQRESRRSVIALVLSALAIIASGIAVTPQVVSWSAQSTEATRFVTNIVSRDYKTVSISKGASSENTAAYRFAIVVQYILLAYEDSDPAALRTAAPGRVDATGINSFRACFPVLDAWKPRRCFRFDNFEFTDSGRVYRFTMDDVPVESLISNASNDSSPASESATNQDWRAFIPARFYFPLIREKIVVFHIDRETGVNNTDVAPLNLSVQFVMDGRQAHRATPALHFPASILKYEDKYGIVTTSAKVEYARVCATGNLNSPDYPCNWIDKV